MIDKDRGNATTLPISNALLQLEGNSIKPSPPRSQWPAFTLLPPLLSTQVACESARLSASLLAACCPGHATRASPAQALETCRAVTSRIQPSALHSLTLYALRAALESSFIYTKVRHSVPSFLTEANVEPRVLTPVLPFALRQ